MEQLLHGSAKTTEAIRQAIQESSETVQVLSDRYHLNERTVMKWKKRNFTHDMPMGPKSPSSTVSRQRKRLFAWHFVATPCYRWMIPIHAARNHSCADAFFTAPAVSASGISRLPQLEGDKKARKKFKDYPIGYFHIDIAEVHTEEGRLYLFVAIDRTSKFTYAELHKRATRRIAASFLKALTAAVPYTIHTVLTDNGIQFTDTKGESWTTAQIQKMMANRKLFVCGAFDYLCAKENIDHRLTKPAHPWTNGQVERMNRTIKEATVKRYHYGSHEQLKEHLKTFLLAYNFAKRLKTLKRLTPHEFICKTWQKETKRFKINPAHLTMGLNIYFLYHPNLLKSPLTKAHLHT